MASIVKITATTTINVESDILNKDAGELIKDAFKQLIPVLVSGIKKEFDVDESKTESVKEAPKGK